jgi:hypothetical protein
LTTAFLTTLERLERDRFMVQMMKLASEELPIWPLYHNPDATAYVSSLRGPVPLAPGSVRE